MHAMIATTRSLRLAGVRAEKSCRKAVQANNVNKLLPTHVSPMPGSSMRIRMMSSVNQPRQTLHKNTLATTTAAILAAGIVSWLGITSASADAGVSDSADVKGSDASLGAAKQLISMQEVQKHNSLENGVWVVIEENVYDVTSFIEKHPGGAQIILKNAGKDVTQIYVPVHPSDAIQQHLSPKQCLGRIDPATVPKETNDGPISEREKHRRKALANLPPVGSLLNLDDFERVAQTILTDQAWAYYSSAADDEITKHQNRSSYARIWFKPRCLQKVSHVDASSTILDRDVSLPIYISPAAMAKLGHPLGEVNLTRAAGLSQIVQGISANASCSLDELLAARVNKEQTLFYQLYVNKDRKATEKILHKLESLPKGNVSALMLTVDAPVMGNRESDARAKGEVVKTGGETKSDAKGGRGVGEAISGYIDPNVCWDDLRWIKKHCSLPLILKGVGSVADVALAAQHGCKAVVLSNHGGRSLEFAPAPIDVLIELREKRPDLFEKIDIFIDGGVRRGTDVLKAIALGAKAVGLGRPFLYAQSGYGEQGAERAIAIMRDEIHRAMRFLGITKLNQLKPDMIDILPRTFDPYLLHRKEERARDYPFEHE